MKSKKFLSTLISRLLRKKPITSLIEYKRPSEERTPILT